jgi:hypothetical protein
MNTSVARGVCETFAGEPVRYHTLDAMSETISWIDHDGSVIKGRTLRLDVRFKRVPVRVEQAAPACLRLLSSRPSSGLLKSTECSTVGDVLGQGLELRSKKL